MALSAKSQALVAEARARRAVVEHKTGPTTPETVDLCAMSPKAVGLVVKSMVRRELAELDPGELREIVRALVRQEVR